VGQTGGYSGSLTEPAGGFVNSLWCGTNRWDRHRLYLFRLPLSPTIVLPRPCGSIAGTVDPLFQPALSTGLAMTIPLSPYVPSRLHVTTVAGSNPLTLDTCILVVRHKKCNTTCGVLACYDDINRPSNLLSDGIFVFPAGCDGTDNFLKVGLMYRGQLNTPNLEWAFDYQQ
jgi:hypothetical protein